MEHSANPLVVDHQRAGVVRVARSFVGTPYHHMGRVKGAGVDCATLLAEVYYEAGLLSEPVAIEYYPMDWHLHRDEERYLRIVQRYCREIPEEQALPGDIVVYHFGRAWAHGGIVINVKNSFHHGDTETRKNLAIVSSGHCVIENGQMAQSANGQMLIIHAVLNQTVQVADGERDGMLVGRKRRYFSPW